MSVYKIEPFESKKSNFDTGTFYINTKASNSIG